MQFENEPKGWDDHIVTNPPNEQQPDDRLDASRGCFFGVISGAAFWAGVALIFWMTS